MMIRIEVFSLLLLFASSASSVPHRHLNEQEDIVQVEESYEQQPRIIGGRVTPIGRYEYFVRVDSNANIICGGVLVAPDIVMTAGHCKADALSVVVNGYDESNPYNLNHRQYLRQVTNAVRHPSFNAETLANDILLLKLSSPVYDIDYIQMNFDNNYPPAGQDVIAMGLGRIDDGTYSNLLREVTVQAINSNVCNAKYAKAGLKVQASLMLCAGTDAGGKDACAGDSGGPLITSNDLLVGISSWGVGCARPDFPGVYTRISGFKTWLTANICSMSDVPPNWCSQSFTPAAAATTQVCKDGDKTFQVGSLRQGRYVTCAQLQTASSTIQERYCVKTSAWELCQETCGRCGSRAGIYDAAKATKRERQKNKV